jgi:ribonuclease BN (tRNA processing enzyme)
MLKRDLRRVVLLTITIAIILNVPRILSGQSATKKGTRVITLGTRSGPFPTAVRAQSSNALIVDDAVYLIDTGDGAARRLARAGIAIRNIEAIFLTHLHDDHTTGLVPLMSVEWQLDRSKNVGIYGPPETETLVGAALKFLTVNSDIRLSEGTRTRAISTVFTGHDIQPGVVYRDDNITVRAVENDHFHFPDGSPAAGKTRSYSYRFETPDRTIVFTGDMGPNSTGVMELAKGADLLIIEVNSVEELKELRIKDGSWARWTPEQQANFIHHQTEEHLTAEDVARIAARAGVKTVVLTHLPASTDLQDKYQRYAEVVKKGFSGRVLVAEDLAEF